MRSIRPLLLDLLLIAIELSRLSSLLELKLAVISEEERLEKLSREPNPIPEVVEDLWLDVAEVARLRDEDL